MTVINKFDCIHTTNRLFFSSQGNFEIVIDVVDDDTSEFPDQYIDTVLIELTVANASSTSLTFQGLRNDTPSEAAISFSFTCDTDYYGSLCTVYCLAQDDTSGHYTCDPMTGSIICNDGFTGSNCEVQQIHFRALISGSFLIYPTAPDGPISVTDFSVDVAN